MNFVIKSTNKKSVLYNELGNEKSEVLFYCAKFKYLHNIDSLYYSIRVRGCWKNDAEAIVFKDYLAKYREKANSSFQPELLFQEDYLYELGTEYICNGIGSVPYVYDFEKKDKYIVFIMNHQPNTNTPQFWVQLRSQYLWLSGEYAAVSESLQDIENILSKFGLEIMEVKENRIDYAYHTNYIQDPLSFFKEENLNKMQQSRFSRYSKEGHFVGEWYIESDYITLGRKTSNNVFFRVYNKTKEVVEKGYKQFFLKLWYLENMISYFDFYCLERAFYKQSWRHLDIARLEFYLDFGVNEEYKQKVNLLLNSTSYNYDEISKFADKLVGKVTLVCNVEIETKRKFYYSFEESVKLLKVKTDCKKYAIPLYKILDNKQLFHDFLTRNNGTNDGIIRFINWKAKNKDGVGWTRKKEYPTADWWCRLQKTKVNRNFDVDDVVLVRSYQKNLDIQFVKKRLVNQLATYNIYLKHEKFNENIEGDVLDFMSTLNENDIENMLDYKQKKFAQLKARLEGAEKTESIRTFAILDSVTGEITK